MRMSVSKLGMFNSQISFTAKSLKHDSAQKARDLPAGRQVQGAKISSKLKG